MVNMEMKLSNANSNNGDADIILLLPALDAVNSTTTLRDILH